MQVTSSEEIARWYEQSVLLLSFEKAGERVKGAITPSESNVSLKGLQGFPLGWPLKARQVMKQTRQINA